MKGVWISNGNGLVVDYNTDVFLAIDVVWAVDTELIHQWLAIALYCNLQVPSSKVSFHVKPNPSLLCGTGM